MDVMEHHFGNIWTKTGTGDWILLLAIWIRSLLLHQLCSLTLWFSCFSRVISLFLSGSLSLSPSLIR